MTYIKLEDIKKILIKEKQEWVQSEFLSVIEEYFDTVEGKINSLPSINPEEIIQELFDETEPKILNSEYEFQITAARGACNILERLLQEFKS